MSEKKKPDINQRFEDLKKTVLKSLKSELEKVNEFPHDFNSNALHETVQKEVDCFVTGFERSDSISWIDFCGNEDIIDEGIIDRSSLERTLITMAYECIRQMLFDECSLIYDMQEYDLNEIQRDVFINQIDKIIGAFKPTREDSDGQIWVKLGFPLSFEDFPEPGFNKAQMVDLHDGIKILASNVSMNRNAIVIEKPTSEGDQARIYLMEKDKEIDIRDFFKYTPTIKENNYSLLASDYTAGKIKKEFTEKKEFIWYINQMVGKLLNIK